MIAVSFRQYGMDGSLFMTDSINKQTLSEQIYLILKNDILTRQIPCGSKLTLQSLRNRFNVSHTPIREALTRLSQDELVTYYSNVGVRVITLTANDAREIFQLMAEFDCLALQYAYAGEMRAALLDELADIVRASDESAAKKDLAAWRDYSDRFHLVFYKYCNNSRLVAASEKLFAQITLLINTYQLLDSNVEMINQDHKRIYEALPPGKIDTALKLLRKHFNDDMYRAIKTIG